MPDLFLMSGPEKIQPREDLSEVEFLEVPKNLSPVLARSAI